MTMRLTSKLGTACLLLGVVTTACAQTTPVEGYPAGAEPDMPLADYLGLLQQLSPAASEGARTYLGAYLLRCRQSLQTQDLRLAMSQDGGNPVLMGLIRASHQQDRQARDHWIGQLRCPNETTTP